MACLACVRACSEAFYKKFDCDTSSIQIIEKNGEPKPMVCIQCGKCARTCEVGAITQNPAGVYMINKKLCTSCGKCKEVCPFGVIVHSAGSPASKCIACGICAKSCPMDILEVVEK
jgi:Fe-S-cluster-containing hydrogenase component 2